MKTKTWFFRTLLNSIIVIFVIVGIVLNYTVESNTAGLIFYFTTQSNIWVGLICLVWVIFDICKIDVRKPFYIIKFALTVSITLTGLVYNFILAPQAAIVFGSILRAYSWSTAILHIIVPILAIVSYLVFDTYILNKKWAFTGVILPLFYFVFILILSTAVPKPLFMGFDGKPSKFPYFFLDYINNGWFDIGSDISKLGTFYWLLIAITLVLGISFVLICFHRICHRKHTASGH